MSFADSLHSERGDFAVSRQLLVAMATSLLRKHERKYRPTSNKNKVHAISLNHFSSTNA